MVKCTSIHEDEVINKDGFRESLSVRGSFEGRAPVVVGQKNIVCLDRASGEARNFKIGCLV